MIHKITVTNYRGEVLPIDVRFPEQSGLLVMGATGLGPSNANINTTDMSTSDGALFNSARLNSRNIVLTFKLLDSPTIEAVRQKTYKYFPVKKQLKLTIESNNRTCEVYGYVESNDPTFFKEEETTQISIICPDPYFYSAGEDGRTVTIFSGIEALFEFPFENNSLVGNLIEAGTISTLQEQNVVYNGDSEIGVMIYIHALGPVTNITIYNSGTREIMKIDTVKLTTLTGSTLVAGDDIIISTIKGNKYIQLLRDGEYINILNCLDKNTDWFQLAKGDNIFAFTADTGITFLQFRVENQTAYEGV